MINSNLLSVIDVLRRLNLKADSIASRLKPLAP
ncbi:hypothetical protein EniLVp02_0170 [Vibrio phage EniLVp02]